MRNTPANLPACVSSERHSECIHHLQWIVCTLFMLVYQYCLTSANFDVHSFFEGHLLILSKSGAKLSLHLTTIIVYTLNQGCNLIILLPKCNLFNLSLRHLMGIFDAIAYSFLSAVEGFLRDTYQITASTAKVQSTLPLAK